MSCTASICIWEGRMASLEVVVVGAGPTGLTLVCSLRLFSTGDRPCGRARPPRRELTCTPPVLRCSTGRGRPDKSLRALLITTFVGDRPIMTMRFGDPGLRTAAPPMVVSQAEVEAALRDRLAELGGAPEWN